VRRNKSQEKRVAQERINVLFGLAEKEALGGNWARADRYVGLARTIGMRYNVPPSSEHRRKFCRGCHTFMLPSVTARVRVGGGKVAYTCIKCGRVSRFPYIRERRERRTRKAVEGKDTRREVPQEEEV